jgi:hypothetical protein
MNAIVYRYTSDFVGLVMSWALSRYTHVVDVLNLAKDGGHWLSDERDSVEKAGFSNCGQIS